MKLYQKKNKNIRVKYKNDNYYFKVDKKMNQIQF